MAKSLAWLVAGLMIFVGGNVVGIGNVLDAHNDRKLLSGGVRTVGVVTNVGFSTGGRGSEYKDLTISFLAENSSVYAKGLRQRYYSKTEGSKSAVSDELQGKEITVFYDRSDPSKSVIEGSPESFTAGYLLIALSLGFGASFMRTGVVGLGRK
ncbi:DUF3592 domain-containing protein [Arthrobacter sp. UYP6]|uniref:DUF3592 domain-containing protein n=1 Tax=Arthrobacter sp. UYP6 TaxID=1756378 RepID=UPI003391F3B6